MKIKYISMPLPIKDIFGETNSHTKVILILFAGIAVILFGWLLVFLPYGVQWWVMVIFQVLWGLIWLSEFLGEGKKKRANLKRILAGQTASEGQIVAVDSIIDDRVTYDNNVVAVLLVGALRYNPNGMQATLDFERYLDALLPYPPKVVFVNRNACTSIIHDAKNARVYVDDEVAKQRFEYYSYQDKISDAVKSYEIVTILSDTISNVTKLEEKVAGLLDSEVTNCFAYFRRVKTSEMGIYLGADVGYHLDTTQLLDVKFADDTALPYANILKEEGEPSDE